MMQSLSIINIVIKKLLRHLLAARTLASDSPESELFDLNNFHVFMNFANKQFPGRAFLRRSLSCGDCTLQEICLSEAILRIKRRRYRLQVQQKIPQKSVHSSDGAREGWKK